MFTAIVVLMTTILPALCSIIAIARGAEAAHAIAQWFAFWSVGVRLGIAGVSQIYRPRFTTETIFGIRDRKARALAREIGFGNLALATIGIASLFVHRWISPAALAGAVFYALAGISHALTRNKDRNRKAAMVTDLVVAAVLAGALVGMAASR